MSSLIRGLGTFTFLVLLARPLSAQPLYVPNASFESPATEFVDNHLERWQHSPKPFWYDESSGFTWDQLFGIFKNTEPGKPDHLGNLEGAQAIYLFAVPEAAIFQDAVGAGRVLTAGYAYEVTASLLGGGGGMTNGVSLEMDLYWVNPAGERVSIAATNVVHDPTRFTSLTNFVEFAVKTPTVRGTDPWASQPLGLRFRSTVNPALAGGYWDIDHVRLREIPEIPNGSFESPVTSFVDNRVDGWSKTPKPSWYDESSGFTWDQLSGVFRNTEPGKDDHLENVDGNQAVYVFAVPEAGLLLDQGTTTGTNSLPFAPFETKYEPGRAYTLSAAVQGGGGGMVPGVSLELRFCYRDPLGALQTVAATNIVHQPETFPSRHLFAEFQVRTPVVQPSDPWAGRGLGLQILSTVDPARAGGYWNLDHFRLRAESGPALLSPTVRAGQLGLVLQSSPGSRVEVLASERLEAATAAWTLVGTVTNATGFTEFSLPTVPNAESRYYRLREVP